MFPASEVYRCISYRTKTEKLVPVVGKCKWIDYKVREGTVNLSLYLAGTLTARLLSLEYNTTSPTKLQSLLSSKTETLLFANKIRILNTR